LESLVFYQYGVIALIFMWSGVVRSALGFGGVALALPFLLIIDDRPQIYLPIMAAHLLVFSSLTVIKNHRSAKKGFAEPTVAWSFLGKALLIMVIPKCIGVFGLITLPTQIINTIIFTIIGVYSMTYVLNYRIESKHKLVDLLFLIVGGYISGASLIGAPLIVAVFSKYVSRYQLRDTLFALWFVLVCIKMGSFVIADIDLQLNQHLWLLPCAALGHVVGSRIHQYLLTADSVKFYRILGSALLISSTIGLIKAWS
jgi:uncharacterized membrane protein YfcA